MLERTQQRHGVYRIDVNNTGFGSDRFGPCEVCGKHCSEHWIGSSAEEYEAGQFAVIGGSVFGHRECVEANLMQGIEAKVL